MPTIIPGENNQEIITIAQKSSQQIVIDFKTIIKKYQEKFNNNTPEKDLADIFHNYIKALQDSPYPKNLGVEAFSYLFNKEKSTELKKNRMIEIIEHIIPEIVSKIIALEYSPEKEELLTTIKNHLSALKYSEDARHQKVISILEKKPDTKLNPDIAAHKEFQKHGKSFPTVADDVATKIIDACEGKLAKFSQEKTPNSANPKNSAFFQTNGASNKANTTAKEKHSVDTTYRN